MPAQRQTNQHSITAYLTEVRDEDGTLYPAAAVDPGGSIDWPQPIAGFTGWDWAAALAPSVPEEPQQADAPGKSRSKSTSGAATPATTPEATA